MRGQSRFLASFVFLATISHGAIAQTDPQTPVSQEAPVTPDPAIAPSDPVTPPTPPVEPTKPIPAPTPAPKPSKPVVAAKIRSAGDGLKPGQFVWEKRAVASSDLRIVAVLDIQRIYVFDGGTLVAFSTISTGKKGHSTPTGSFKILQKNVEHFSSIYDNAPMPFMQRLTWDGIALHAGKIPGYPASHGCIRLPLSFAKSLFGITKMDQQVMVLSDLKTPAPKETPPTEPQVDEIVKPIDQPVPGVAPPPTEPVEAPAPI